MFLLLSEDVGGQVFIIIFLPLPPNQCLSKTSYLLCTKLENDVNNDITS